MSQDTNLPVSTTSSATEALKAFKPSISAIREYILRQRADRMLDQFAERFTEEDFFPEGGDDLLFAILTALPQWPTDAGIVVLDHEGTTLARYLKGNDWGTVQHSITFVRRDDGTYGGPDNTQNHRTESLFRVLFSQLPPTSEIGNWGEDRTVPGRITMLRAQISVGARQDRALMFDALMADAHVSKSGSISTHSNLFLPFSTSTEQDWSPVLLWLNEDNLHLPVGRLEDLLRAQPLSDDQETDLLHDGMLPEAFFNALEESRNEWAHDRAIDGLLHTRVYDEQTDALAYTFAEHLLKTQLGRDLVVTEYADIHQPTGQADNCVALVSFGEGLYGRHDQDATYTSSAANNTDSFYLAIISQLRADELSSLGLKSDDDVTGLRRAITELAVADNGGWFPFEEIAPPVWFDQASSEDKVAWQDAAHEHLQALIDAQAPGLPDVLDYGDSEQLGIYAREKLSERLKIDHELALDPDDIVIEIRTPEVEQVFVEQPITTQWKYRTERCSLTELSLKNMGVLDTLSNKTATARNRSGEQIDALTFDYLYNLVRDLDVGETYAQFLTTRLVTSAEGEWRKERYVQVMQTHMRLHALQAKICGDFVESRLLPAERKDRAYKWVIAAIDNPVEGAERARVEGHEITVQRMKVNGVILDGLLLIAPASREAVASVVLYIPQAPDGKCFRLFEDGSELRDEIFRNPDFLEYLVSHAPSPWQAEVRESLTASPRNFMLDTVPLSRNFYGAAYDARVAHVIAAINEQTNTTWERNWRDTWDITLFVGDVALMFAPFYIALPVASLQIVYALIQGVVLTVKGERAAALYFNEAALLLVGLFLGAGSRPPKAMGAGHSIFNPKAALRNAPDDLKLRTDGVFNGVYETRHHGAVSRFYVKDAGQTYPVRYDSDYGVFRLIDPRRPSAFYQAPIRSEGGRWAYANVGLSGGKPKKTKDAAGNETNGAAGGTAGGQTGGGSAGVFKLDMTEYSSEKLFNKREQGIRVQLDKSVAKIIDKFELDPGAGHFHGVEKIKREVVKESGRTGVVQEKLFTIDIPDMPDDRGRGAWRLKVREPYDRKGVVVFHEVMRTHRSKR